MASIIKSNTYADFNGREILTANNDGALTTQKTNYPAFYAEASSSTSVSNNSSTKLTLDDLQFDTNSGWDSTNYRWVCPTGYDGKYFFRGSGRISGLGNAKVFALELRKNGTVINESKILQSTGVSDNIAHSVTGIQEMVADDYIEIFIYHNNGTTLTAPSGWPSLGGFRIGS